MSYLFVPIPGLILLIAYYYITTYRAYLFFKNVVLPKEFTKLEYGYFACDAYKTNDSKVRVFYYKDELICAEHWLVNHHYRFDLGFPCRLFYPKFRRAIINKFENIA